MKEISDIIAAYTLATQTGKKTALATVVKVEGSSYRQPGARMLVTNEGDLTGAISGGCLEGDALRKALLAINQKTNKLITYDTSNEDDLEFGVQLGCNGIIHILFEYIDETIINNPIELLKNLFKARKEAVVSTLFSLDRNRNQIGTVLFYTTDNSISRYQESVLELFEASKNVIAEKKSKITTTKIDLVEYELLLEYIPPVVSLVIVGAGNDVKPLANIAEILGWETTVADGRATHATIQRFPSVNKVRVIRPQQLISETLMDSNTFFVLMTHNYKYDFETLELLLATPCRYIGILGPKTKLERMINELNNKGIKVKNQDLERIYGPIGLDLAAETSEEIALSIIAEIKAVMGNKKGTSLKYKQEKIHATV